jgi:3-hydroxyacyl-[acyl-carrier-protein] dehydratase
VSLSIPEVLALIPQQRPFRFIDELLSIDADTAVGRYRFREDESFYVGHFPGNPITPGVILIETMCQTALVAHGVFLLADEVGRAELERATAFFTDSAVEFARPVRPGEAVQVHARKEYWRRRKLRSRVELTLDDGTPVASGYVAGVEVVRGG